jgi:hypothetical protein
MCASHTRIVTEKLTGERLNNAEDAMEYYEYTKTWVLCQSCSQSGISGVPRLLFRLCAIGVYAGLAVTYFFVNHGSLSLPLSSYTATTNQNSASAPTQLSTSGYKINVSLPTQDDVQNTRRLWELTPYQDLKQPGTKSYNISVTIGSKWRWSFSWCGKDKQQLQKILKPFSISFWVDNTKLPANDIFEYDYTSSRGWACHSWSTVLTYGQQFTQAQLSINYELAASVNDGETNYPKGSYSQVLNAKVK